MNSLEKSDCHIHYEEFNYYKKFHEFTINTLTTIACPNFKNKRNASPGQLGVKEAANVSTSQTEAVIEYN